jgi:hypothetical protein
MTKLARIASIAAVSFFAIFGQACTVESTDGFVEYHADGMGETGDFNMNEDEQQVDDSNEENLCGNGELDANEECDEGADNADNAACTASCSINTCGDGMVFEGVEECDMGDLNGANSSCNAECESA